MAENNQVRSNAYDETLDHDSIAVAGMGRSNTPFVYHMVMGALERHSQEGKIVEVGSIIGNLSYSDPSSVRIIQGVDGLTQVILDAGKMGTCTSSLNLSVPIENILDGLTLNLPTF